MNDLDYSALYIKNFDRKRVYINKLIENKRAAGQIDQVVYFCPKKQAEQTKELLECKAYIYYYEDIDKTNEPYNLAGERTMLILDNCARYKNILTKTFKRLVRLAQGYKHKLVVDIVPFTTGIEYLYVPWAYLSRTVLQHQHWYAFKENNPEETPSGEIVLGHDYRLLAGKIAPYCEVDYSQFFENETSIIHCPLTEAEKKGYAVVREGLFQRFDTYQPIITRLADYTNMVESRYNKLDELLQGVHGKTIIYTNIKSHNAPLKNRFKMPVMTYYDNNGDEREADNIVLFEVPIVKSYLFLDVLANIKPECKVWIFTSDSTADKLLLKKMTEEYTAVNDFTKVLWEVKHGRT